MPSAVADSRSALSADAGITTIEPLRIPRRTLFVPAWRKVSKDGHHAYVFELMRSRHDTGHLSFTDVISQHDATKLLAQ
jgi:hypothetical protein